MPTDPTRPSYTRAQRLLLTGAAGLVVAALAGGAFALTYDVLRELAIAGGVSRRWAPLYPAMADTLTAVTILSLVVARGARWWTRLPRWTLLLLLLAGGAALSVQHSVRGFGALPDDAVRTGVAVAPHAMLVIAVWLWLTMVKQIRTAARSARRDEAPAETQRGHVKVLGPAAPPLALEAPAGQDGEPSPAFSDGQPAEREPDPVREPDPEPVRDSEPEPEREPILPFKDDGREWPAAKAGPAPEEFDPFDYEESLSSEPAPPLEPLPQPRPPLDSVPDLLPTDVELVRGKDAVERQSPTASTTRPDIVLPDTDGTDEDEHDDPPTDRAEDPDAGDPSATDPDLGDRSTRGDWNPPPSSNFRSGPTPPAE
ncbi:DUF2637 domain-containing protein [Actinomadura sp. WMMA1423]|uniref:DUF2637 domain-containing protein n=1 Tax=Actinomadura sp. WMMA1423 TaxID=2591108 RepID=UPI0011479172|nr:DUF2637 domain-containing protein [Actinomadura sp. WMMA1423]